VLSLVELKDQLMKQRVQQEKAQILDQDQQQ
jgi:hypothetical protein